MTLKERTAAISLAASFILAAAKLVVGLAIGSLALITDALHSCVDFLATGVTWMAVRVGGQAGRRLAPLRPRKIREHRGARRGDAAAPARRRRDGGGGGPHQRRRAAAAAELHRRRRAADRDRRQRLAGARAAARRAGDAQRGARSGFAALRLRRVLLARRARRLRAHRARLLAGAMRRRRSPSPRIIAVLALRLVIHTINALVDRAPEGVADLITDAHARDSRRARRRERARPLASARGISSRRPSRCRARSGSSRWPRWRPRRRCAARSVLAGADVTMQSRAGLAERRDGARARAISWRSASASPCTTSPSSICDDRLALALDLEVDGALPLADAHATADRLEAAIRREFGRAGGDRDPHRAARAGGGRGERDAGGAPPAATSPRWRRRRGRSTGSPTSTTCASAGASAARCSSRIAGSTRRRRWRACTGGSTIWSG